MPDGPTTTLEYFPDRRGTDSSAVAMMVFALPLMVAALLGGLGWGALALPGAAATALFMWMQNRRRKKRPQAVLRVENGRVSVEVADPHMFLKLAFDDLHDVTLDTKTIQRVQENLRSG